MAAASTPQTTQGAATSAGLNDSCRLVIGTPKLNGVEAAHGSAGIPVTGPARLVRAPGIGFIGFRSQRRSACRGGCRVLQRARRARQRHNASLPGGADLRIQRAAHRRSAARRRRNRPAGSGPASVKAAYRVKEAEDIGRSASRVIRAAVPGRPGGVYVDVPAAVPGEAVGEKSALLRKDRP